MWWEVVCVLVSHFPQDLAILDDDSYQVLDFVDYEDDVSDTNSTVLHVTSTTQNFEFGFATPAMILDHHNAIRKRRKRDVSYTVQRRNAEKMLRAFETIMTRRTTVLGTTVLGAIVASEYPETIKDTDLYPESLNSNDITDLTRKTLYYPTTKTTPPNVVVREFPNDISDESQNTIPDNEYLKESQNTRITVFNDWLDELQNFSPVDDDAEEAQKTINKVITWQALNTHGTVTEKTSQKADGTVTEHTTRKAGDFEKETSENNDLIRGFTRQEAKTATWVPQIIKTLSLTTGTQEEASLTTPTYETSTVDVTESIFIAPKAVTVNISIVVPSRPVGRRRRKSTTVITTTETVSTTTFPFNYRLVDAKKLLKLFDYVVAGDVNQFNLSQKFNETLQRYKIPMCDDMLSMTTTEAPSTINFNDAPVVAKCFVCGLDVEGIPYSSACADAFAGDFIPLVPVDPKGRGQIATFRKYCRYLDSTRVIINEEEPHSVFGRFTGGCSVRWVDLTNVYTQRACRNRRRAVLGKHFASKRMAKLEMALNDLDNGCIISPMATLLPVSRGVSLYARFHACVCTGSWCNGASVTQHWIANTVLMLAVVGYGS